MEAHGRVVACCLFFMNGERSRWKEAKAACGTRESV